jgi:hypothetical protein
MTKMKMNFNKKKKKRKKHKVKLPPNDSKISPNGIATQNLLLSCINNASSVPSLMISLLLLAQMMNSVQ